jgi:hypothetical protein
MACGVSRTPQEHEVSARHPRERGSALMGLRPTQPPASRKGHSGRLTRATSASIGRLWRKAVRSILDENCNRDERDRTFSLTPASALSAPWENYMRRWASSWDQGPSGVLYVGRPKAQHNVPSDAHGTSLTPASALSAPWGNYMRRWASSGIKAHQASSMLVAQRAHHKVASDSHGSGDTPTLPVAVMHTDSFVWTRTGAEWKGKSES